MFAQRLDELDPPFGQESMSRIPNSFMTAAHTIQLMLLLGQQARANEANDCLKKELRPCKRVARVGKHFQERHIDRRAERHNGAKPFREP